MPLTMTNVSNPQASITEFPLGPFKGRIVDLSLVGDTSYLTGGEVLTAAALGWNVIFGAIPVSGGFATSTGALSADTIVKPNAAQTQLTFQLQETAATVDTPTKEVSSGQDMSAYSGRYLVLGM